MDRATLFSLVLASALTFTGSSAHALVEVTNVSDISLGARHACLLKQTGGIQCWGANESGQLGDGSTVKRAYAAGVSGLTSGVIAVSAGGIAWSDQGLPQTGHTCAIATSGGVKCWGANENGQLGNGTTTPSSVPVDVTGLSSGVVAISAGGKHTCAVTSSGGVKCWGANVLGEVGDGTTTQRLTPVDVSGLSSGVANVAAAHLHTCALTTAGAMLCWGANESGQLGDGTTIPRLTPVAVSSLSSGVVEIAAARGAAPNNGISIRSGGNSCAVTSSGAAKCWGANRSSQIGDGTTTPRLTPFDVTGLTTGTAMIAAGSWSQCGFGLADKGALSHACAVTSGGGVKCWGGNNHDAVGIHRTTATCGGSGTIQSTPIDVPGMTSGQLVVGTGSAYTCALGSDTKVRCWGTNEEGQLGAGEPYNQPSSSAAFDRTTPAPVMQNESELASQAIVFGPAPTIPVGGTGTVTATGGGSGNPVVLTSLTPETCSVSGSTVTGLANDICAIAANQAGNATFQAAPQATLDLLIGDKVAQSMTFGPAPTIVVGGTGKVSATASSGLAVSFTSNTPGICSVSGDVVSGLAAGTCTIAGDQSGNLKYSAAPQTTQNITVTSSASSVANLSVAQSQSPSSTTPGKDVMYTATIGNSGPAASDGVTLQDVLPSGMTFVWASSSCSHASGTVTCSLGTLSPGATVQVRIVARPTSSGSKTHTVTVSGSAAESDYTNNRSTLVTAVGSAPAATPVLRYRLYNDGTKEHLFTTDLNEYMVLGNNGWIQEGTAGRVLDNPGAYNGVEAIPYYRLYNSGSAWHHWTSDANEYYTLVEFPGWNGEGVDGYILPTSTVGATQLYRLLYPFVPGLHHWTIDANEYNTLTDSAHGWIGEGGAGFAIQ